MKEEIERIKTLLGLHYFIHERLFRETRSGYIGEKDVLVVLRKFHNIPKDECPVIVKGLEILGLINKEDNYFKVMPPKKSREELVFEFKKKLKLV